MQKVPLESLDLFEQLDRPVLAFLKKEPAVWPDNLYISVSESDYEEKEEQFERAGYQTVKMPLGMALDNVIQQEDFTNLIIGGLFMVEIIISKEELFPLKEVVDSFCIMFAAANNRLENIKAYDLMKSKTVYFIGRLLPENPQPGDSISYEGIERQTEQGRYYEAITCFLTPESAEKFNKGNHPITAANLEHLKHFWGKPVIIEPHRNYWIEFR